MANGESPKMVGEGASTEEPSGAKQPDFIAQFRAEMVRVLPTRSLQEKAAFAALDVQEQTWRFMNWLSRLVHPHPREVHKAVGFDELPDVQANQRQVGKLLDSIARGDNLIGNLSKDAREQGFCIHRANRKFGADFDLLLNEWGIHHLHIDGVDDGKLLYAIFVPGFAYILAVAPHREWTSKRLVEAAVRSWPQKGLFVTCNVLLGLGPTEQEHKALRKAGLTTLTTVSDRGWISALTVGLTTALVSVRMSYEASRVLRRVHNAAQHYNETERQLRKNASLNRLSWPLQPDVTVCCVRGIDRYCFAFIERNSGATLII